MGMMQRCPVCKSYNIAGIVYGLILCEPTMPGALREVEDRGDIPDVLEREITGRHGYIKTVHAGCSVEPPEWECGQCGWRWPPREDEPRAVHVSLWTERVFCPECGGLEC